MNLNLVSEIYICDGCLDGLGGWCHTPGCVFRLNRAPDLPIREQVELCGGKIKLLGDAHKDEKEWEEFKETEDYKFELKHGRQFPEDFE